MDDYAKFVLDRARQGAKPTQLVSGQNTTGKKGKRAKASA
jgi:hypothetical protein